MKDSLSDYLQALGAPSNLVGRIDELVTAYESVLPEPIESEFISEYRSETDERIFESLWMFSGHFAMEAKLLGDDEDQFDFVPHKDSVRHIVVHKRAFDLAEANGASRMSVNVWFTDQRYGVLKATGENCLILASVVKEQLIPNALLAGGE